MTCCSPLYATPPTPSRPTDANIVAAWARLLGHRLQPWQLDVARVAGELDPATGRPAYTRVVLIAPRRAGKSLLVLCRGLATCSRPRSRAFYTSGHRENAARMWRDDWFRQVADFDPDGHQIRITRGNGQEALSFTRRNGASTFRLVAASGSAIRGAATNLIVVDEARELAADVGDDVEAAAFPTLATGRGGQAWIVSSAGGPDSTWLARWRDIGRAAVAADRRSRVCYVEYAAPPDADPDDEATWIAAHPGLASGNVHLDYVRADRETMPPDTFAAEYLGWWPETLADTALIDGWAAATRPEVTMVDPVVLALELDPDRTTVAIVAVGAAAGGGMCAELVAARPHGSWLADEVTRLVAVHRPLAVVWDAAGPVGALAHDLDAVPANLVPLGTRDVVAASGHAYDTILARALGHRDDPDLAAAVGAARRRVALGSWVFDRRQPGAGPLVAAALGLWVFRDRTRHAPTVH